MAVLLALLLLVPGLPAVGQGADTAMLTFRLTLDGDVPPEETFVATYGTQEGGGSEVPLCGEGAGRDCAGGGASFTQSVALPRGTRYGAGFVRRSDRIRDGGGLIGCCIQPFGGTSGPGDEVLGADRTLAASYDFGSPGGRAVGLTFRLTVDGELPPGQLIQLVIGEVERSRGVPRAQAIVCGPFAEPCAPGSTYTVTIAADYGYVEGQTIRHAFRRYAGGQVYEGGPPEEIFGEGDITLAGDTAISISETFARRCFAETGQCVEGHFLRYWEANGGLARNGFPLTGLRYDQLEDGRYYQVQYFERVRMEYHPENQPPHDVLLGQFGRRIHGGADPPLPPPSGPIPADRVYIAETGHFIVGQFFNYWYVNGGVTQFGYPITEQFEEALEDGRVYRVQYFERARFELHPENQPPYDILLGQFGRRILAEVGAGP
jgi:hypothetical protein